MLQAFPNHSSKSPCELRFSRLLLPESHAQCFNSDWDSGFTSQVWTEGLHIKNCGGKGCIYTRSATRSIRGQYEVSLYGLSRSSPWASEAGLLRLSWHLLSKQWAAKTWEYLSCWFFLPTELRLGRPFGNWTVTPFTTYCTANFRNSGEPLEFKVEAMSLSMFSMCDIAFLFKSHSLLYRKFVHQQNKDHHLKIYNRRAQWMDCFPKKNIQTCQTSGGTKEPNWFEFL